MPEKLTKKQANILTVVLILIILVIIGWAFFPKGKIPSEKEVIPEKKETTEETLERLTPKEAKPQTETEEEKKEQKELLNQLTPSQPKPMTEEEEKELEELLKKLTP